MPTRAEILEAQQRICAKYGSPFVPADENLKVGIALHTLAAVPIHGVRSDLAGDTTGWYIWGGESSANPDFFQPLCVHHLDEFCPQALGYLGLAPGFGFIIDHAGYEDVWFDQDRLQRERAGGA